MSDHTPTHGFHIDVATEALLDHWEGRGLVLPAHREVHRPNARRMTLAVLEAAGALRQHEPDRIMAEQRAATDEGTALPTREQVAEAIRSRIRVWFALHPERLVEACDDAAGVVLCLMAGATDQPSEDEWRCKRCGSDRWVAASLTGPVGRGFHGKAIRQCVPCGRYSDDPVVPPTEVAEQGYTVFDAEADGDMG
jgi:hypothetical protein